MWQVYGAAIAAVLLLLAYFWYRYTKRDSAQWQQAQTEADKQAIEALRKELQAKNEKARKELENEIADIDELSAALDVLAKYRKLR